MSKGNTPRVRTSTRRHATSKNSPTAPAATRFVAEPLERRVLLAATLYLDFGGEPSSTWRYSFQNGLHKTFTETAVPPLARSDLSVTADDQNWILEYVREKFSPFDLNVALGDSPTRPDRQIAQVVLTPSYGWFASLIGDDPGGGVASSVGSFFNSGSNTAYVWTQTPSGAVGKADLAAAAVHEAAHLFGLYHQSVWSGTTLSQKYNDNNPSTSDRDVGRPAQAPWVAPLMGTPYKARAVWWQGTNETSNTAIVNDVNDLALGPAGASQAFFYDGLTFRSDFNNSIQSAQPLGTTTDGWSQRGVIERVSDVDYYAVTTSGGTVRFEADVPVAGAMLDPRMRLFNAAGAELTQASIVDGTYPGPLDDYQKDSLTVTLTAGTYYLEVRGKGAVPASDGIYLDVGSYTIRGSVATADTTRPTATLSALNVSTAGATGYAFSVRYDDNVSVNAATFGTGDVVVTGPGGYSQTATYLYPVAAGNGTPRSAVYQIIPPGGTWDAADNGTYTVTMQSGQVSDTSGYFVSAGTIGTFQVSIGTTTATPTSLTISGPSSVAESQTGQYSASAAFSDGSSRTVTPVWSIVSGPASINASTGLLTANLVTSDTSVTIAASYTSGGVTRTAQKTVTVIDSGSGATPPNLIGNGSFELPTGPWVFGGTTGIYANTIPPEGSKYALLGGVANAGDTMYQDFVVPGDMTDATLTYWYNITSEDTGNQQNDTLYVRLENRTTGAVTLVDYRSNLDRSPSTALGNWRQVTYSLMPHAGQSVRLAFYGNTNATFRTDYRIDDVRAMVTRAPAVTLQSLSISGPSSVNESGSASYSATAFFSNGSSQSVTPIWSTSSSAASISGNGTLQAGLVNSDTAIDVMASYTAGGVTRTASKAVTIANVPEPGPVLYVSTTAFDTGAAAGGGAFVIHNDAIGTMNWTATTSDNWLTILTPSGTSTGPRDYDRFEFTTQANTGSSPRTGRITISAGGASGSPVDVVVTQAANSLPPGYPTVAILEVNPDPRNVPVESVIIRFSEAVTGFDLGDVRLSRNGSSVPLTGAQSLGSADGVVWTLGSLTSLTTAPGSYEIRVVAAGAGIVDAESNPLSVDAVERFTVSSPGVTKQWTGAVSNDWYQGDNWNPVGVPAAGDTVAIDGGTIALESTLSTALFDRLFLNAGTLNWSRGSVAGAVHVAAGATMNVTGVRAKVLSGASVLHNAGTVNWDGLGALVIGIGGVINNLAGGVFDVRGDGQMYRHADGEPQPVFNNAGVFRKSGGGGTAYVGGGLPFTNTDAGTVEVGSGTLLFVSEFNNSGTARALPGGTLGLKSGFFSQTTGTLMLDGGGLSSLGPLHLGGGFLTGVGTITGDVIVDGGSVRPGLSPGQLSVAGGYSQAVGGRLDVEIDGPAAGTQYDQLAVTGSVTLGGPLAVSLGGGYAPAAGQAFVMIDNDGTDPVAGTFAGLPEGAVLTAGGWRLRVSYVGGTGNDVTLTAVGPVAANVVGRHVFYNNSYYDNPANGAGFGDDNAVAADKLALLQGQMATPAHLTGYTKGINGVMIDVANLANDGAGLLAGDLLVRTSTAAGGWAAAPTPTLAVRPGAGSGGADRVVLTWADGAITNKWLQVTLPAGANTGLAAADVFSFGNLVGDADGSRAVNLGDFGALRQDFGQTGRTIANGRSDFNRDGAVNLADFGALRGNFGKSLSAPPVAAAAAATAEPAPVVSAPPEQPDKKRTRPAAPRPADDLASAGRLGS